MISASDYMMLKIRGYEYDGDNDCIVEYKENGQFDRCRKGFIKKTGTYTFIIVSFPKYREFLENPAVWESKSQKS